MTFRETDAPAPDKIIAPPTVAGPVVLTVPSPELFKDELRFWRQQSHEADRSGAAGTRTMAQGISRSLRMTARDRLRIQEMIDNITPLDAEGVGSWYVVGVSLMASSRMLREIIQPLGQSLEPCFDDPDVCIDFQDTDPHRSGLHATEAFLLRREEELGISWPESTTPEWYEGESVYLQVRRPARPTASLQEKYQNFYDTPFVPENFTSIVPRLKAEVWEQG